MKKELKYIFDYYKKKYDLKTTLEFTTKSSSEKSNGRYSLHNNEIEISIGKRETKYYIKILLHEIKHAIDYHLNKTKLMKETEEIDYETFPKSYNRLPFQRRANYFAKKEIRKWK